MFLKPRAILVAMLCAALFMSPTTFASTWNVFTKAYNSESALFYFDADSVIRRGDAVILWVKYVNVKYPDSDGSWSTASRYELTCSNRTAKILAASTYDKTGKFIASQQNPGRANEIAPDSILEGILKAACTRDFPRSKSRKLYFPVKDNDIFQDVIVHRMVLDYRAGTKDTPLQ